MKKITFSAVFAALFSILLVTGVSSCTSDEPVVLESVSNDMLVCNNSSHLRTLSDAYEIALRATSMLDDLEDVRSRGISQRVLDVKNPAKVIRNPLSRGAGVINDTLMYVINYADSMGFAVVSAVKGTPELIAVTMKGSYDPSQPGDNPGFNMYMENAAQVLGSGGIAIDSSMFDPNGHIKPATFEKTLRDTVWIKRVAPKARVNWGQSNPEGRECPNGKSGCALTAAAMAMCGLKYPTSIQLTYNPLKISTLSLNWSELKKLKSWDLPRYGANDNNEVSETIAKLCRQLGKLAGTKYHVDYHSWENSSSGTTTDGVDEMFNELGINHYKGNVTSGSLSNDMNPESEVLVRGTKADDNNSVGHMWLCDGVKHYKIRNRYYRSFDSGATWTLQATDYSQEYIYNMFNWGWNGGENGYFLDMDFSDFNINVQYISIWHW